MVTKSAIKASDTIPWNSLPITEINYSQDNLTKKPFKRTSSAEISTKTISNAESTTKKSVTFDHHFSTKSTLITSDTKSTDKPYLYSTILTETTEKKITNSTESIKTTTSLPLFNLTTSLSKEQEISTEKLQTTFTPIINNCESLNIIAPRIIGGSNAILGQIPWQVKLKIFLLFYYMLL